MNEEIKTISGPVELPCKNSKIIGVYHHVSRPAGGQAAVLITDEEWPKLPDDFREQWVKIGELKYIPL